MSGAEVVALVGLLAAASQLIDYGIKAHSWLSEVSGKYRSSQALKDLHDEANNLLKLASLIKVSFLPRDYIDKFLQGLVTESQALVGLVRRLQETPKSGKFVSKFDRGHMAISWQRRQNEITQHLNCIERHKTSLNLCITAFISEKTDAVFQALQYPTPTVSSVPVIASCSYTLILIPQRPLWRWFCTDPCPSPQCTSDRIFTGATTNTVLLHPSLVMQRNYEQAGGLQQPPDKQSRVCWSSRSTPVLENQACRLAHSWKAILHSHFWADWFRVWL
jgi:hypothetical protein